MRTAKLLSLCCVLVVLFYLGSLSAADMKPVDPLIASRIQALQNVEHTQMKTSARSVLSFVVTTLGGIKGSVQGLDPADVGRAYVTAWTDSITKEGYYKGFAVVDSNFTYRIDSLAAGRYYVTIWAEGYVSNYYPDATDMTLALKVAVQEGAVTENINFTLEKLSPGTGRLSGRVLDASDHPVAMAVIYVHASDQPYFYGKTQTDLDGNYVIEQLKTGKYLVQVVADGFLSQLYDNVYDANSATLVQVTEPNETTHIDLKLSVGGTISGIVTDQNGKPVVGAYVQAMYAKADSMGMEKPIFSSDSGAKTDESGHYIIDGLPTGSFYVSVIVYDPWYKSMAWYPEGQDMSQALPVAVQAGQETGDINIRLRRQSGAGSMAGQVLDRSGQPILNASVYLQTAYVPGFSGPTFGMSAMTNRDGKYYFERVPAGSYQLSCWAQSGWQTVYRWWPDAETMEQAKIVEINEDDVIDAIDFNLPLTIGHASISGYVHDHIGRALQWANIQVTPLITTAENNQNMAWASTDSNGYYHVDQLTAGEYQVYASYWENQNMGQQWWDHKDSVNLATALILAEREQRSKVDFDLTIKPVYGAIVGMVTDAATGLPIPRAYIEIKVDKMDFNKSMRPFWYYPRYAFTDENGRYVFDWMREGAYILSTYCKGGFAYYKDALVLEQATPVKVVGGEKTEANFAMKIRQDGKGVISGTVEQDFGIQPMDSTGKGMEPGRIAAGFQTIAANPIDMAVVIAKPALTILQWPQSEQFYTTLTEQDGSYKLTGLPAGEYYVKSFAAYHMAEYYNDVYDPAKATLVKVDEKEPTLGVDFKLSPMYYMYMREGAMDSRNYSGAMVYGRITDKSGNAVADAMVYLLNEQGEAVGFTNTSPDGSYQLAGMTPGNYTVQATKMGYSATYNGNVASADLAKNVNVGNGTIQVDLTLRPPTTTAVKPPAPVAIPESMILYGNYPNPFNPSTQIRFSLPVDMSVKLTVFNVAGEEVARLVDGDLSAGLHTIEWNGRSASSGLYLYRLQAGTNIISGKMLMLK